MSEQNSDKAKDKPKSPRQEFMSECMSQKISEGSKPTEAMVKCSIEWKEAKENVGEEESKLFLVSTENCPGCKEAKEYFKDDIEKGKIRVVTIDDDKGWDIIKKLRVMSVPMLVVEKPNGKYCKITPDGEEECPIDEEKK